MNDISNLRDTIVPKSDQTNAEDLIGITKDIQVTKVTRGPSDQPMVIHYEGDNGRPFKPCLTMRKMLIHGWGEDGTQWYGRWMRLYCDPEVTFGKDKTGGVRVSHISHINQPYTLMLTVTRGKKKAFTFEPLQIDDPRPTMYPPEKYETNKPKWKELITSGKKTHDQVIAQVQKSGQLTDEQLAEIRGWTVAEPEPAAEGDENLFDD